MTGDDNPFARWSRRKRAAAAHAPAPERPAPTPPAPETESELPEEEILKKLGLPDPDTLTSGDDFKAFLAREVPEYLRQRALRRLWTSNPVLANVDGLVEYGGDFTDAAMVPEVLQTAYRVGKGFLRDAVDPAEADAETAEMQEESLGPAAAEADPAVADSAPAAGAEAADSEQFPDSGEADKEPDPPRPRRMTFRTT